MLELDAIDVEEIATALADQTDYEHRWLSESLQGKGAFRRFRTQLYEHHPDLISTWQAVRDARARQRAVQRLVEQGLIGEDAAQRFTSDHPEPGLP